VSLYVHENLTPNGNRFKLWCRQETNDQQTAHHVSKLDEYELRGLELDGWAIDVGAYIGAVAIPLALDHPDLCVVAVEPIPENVMLLQRNIILNKVFDRVVVCPLAAAAPGDDLVAIRYGGKGRHRFVGNVGPEARDAVDVFDAPGVSLGDLLVFYQIDEVALVKIDCEGCEWSFLSDPNVSKVAKIAGEWHGRFPADFLEGTHEVRFTDDYHFWAVRL
jgi:FkbM family methyltransferase